MSLSEIRISRYLSPKEAAAHLGMSKSFLDKLRVYGGGPAFIKIGSRVRYLVADLEGWALARRYSNTTEAAAKLAA